MNRSARSLVLINCLWLFGGWALGVQSFVQAAPIERANEPKATAVDSLLLDQYPESYAAYSLRKLRSDYDGPAVRVRRSSDGAEQDIGFTSEGWVDTTEISNFVGGGDGYVTAWYAQVEGTPDLTQSDNSNQPRIATGGTVETDGAGKPTVFFDGHYLEASGFGSSIPLDDYTMWGVLDPEAVDNTNVFGIGTLNNKHWETASYRFFDSYVHHNDVRVGDGSEMSFGERNLVIIRNTGNNGDVADLWAGNAKQDETTEDGSGGTKTAVSVGGGFAGRIGEVAFYPSVPGSKVLDFYRNVNFRLGGWPCGVARAGNYAPRCGVARHAL